MLRDTVAMELAAEQEYNAEMGHMLMRASHVK
jgi:hypothetical protein